MSEPLWSDIRVSKEAVEATDELDGSVYVRHVISQLLVKMRGDYEAQLSNQYQRIERFVELVNQLEAQLAQTWQPLPDGEITSFTYVDNGGKLLGVYAGDDYTDWYATEDLPDDIRLCRLVTQEPTLQPDWSKAPEWANWWAVNDDGGFGIWYEAEPKPRIAIPIWQEPEGTRAQISGNVVLPFGIEWRNTLRQRPQEPTPQPAIPPDVRERLADYAHEAWSGWMKYLFSKSRPASVHLGNGEYHETKDVIMPEWAVERWQRQMNTPYAELPESEKASDRDEADAILTIIRAWLDAQEPTL